MLCSRRVILNLAKENRVAGCQHQSNVTLEERRLVEGEVDSLSVSWWYIKTRCPLGRDVIVKSRFWFHSRSLELKFSTPHHARII